MSRRGEVAVVSGFEGLDGGRLGWKMVEEGTLTWGDIFGEMEGLKILVSLHELWKTE